MTAVDWLTIKHFQRSEFICRCCGDEHMQDAFVRKLDDLRGRVGFPLVVSSGWRCPEHNQRVSTTGTTGPHTTGRAADLLLSGGQAFKVLTQCVLGGWMTGIGLHQRGPHALRFVHLDDLPAPDHPRPVVWTY
jgi:zinc D-Ala-D-Ala carboxypeptidase